MPSTKKEAVRKPYTAFDLDPISDPLEMLQSLVAETKHHNDAMKQAIEDLSEELEELIGSPESPSERLAGLKMKQTLMKEQIGLYRGSQKELRELLALCLRHGLEERLVALEEARVSAVAVALGRALSAIGVSGTLRNTAERELHKALGEMAGTYEMVE